MIFWIMKIAGLMAAIVVALQLTKVQGVYFSDFSHFLYHAVPEKKILEWFINNSEMII